MDKKSNSNAGVKTSRLVQSRLGFLDLPRRIRDAIYEFALLDSHSKVASSGGMYYHESLRTNWSTNVLILNHQIRKEALPLVYKDVAVHIWSFQGSFIYGDPWDSIWDVRDWIRSFRGNLYALRCLHFSDRFNITWNVDCELDMSGGKPVSWKLTKEWTSSYSGEMQEKELERRAYKNRQFNILNREVETAVTIVSQLREEGKFNSCHLQLLIDVFFRRCRSYTWPSGEYQCLKSLDPLPMLLDMDGHYASCRLCGSERMSV